MCGRFALALRPGEVQDLILDWEMPAEEAPADDEVRPGYNIAPGYNEIVYRADVPDQGAGHGRSHEKNKGDVTGQEGSIAADTAEPTKYKLQAMKWGLIPFWTKRKPDYGSMMKTINCRDDSLLENRGMWTTMKQRKRCVVLCQGFYEWLKKNGGKEKLPHFIKRKDEKLMCFAGLWDCVQYEGSEEKLYTFTIITTSSNEQMKFIHDRMPVILENGSEEMRTWLDPKRSTWTRELQSLLKPWNGELEIYPVSKDVGKVGNNSPSFVIPITSSENKNNIANFFPNGKVGSKQKAKEAASPLKERKKETTPIKEEERETLDHDGTENNAPLPVPTHEDDKTSIKREYDSIGDNVIEDEPKHKSQKREDTKPVTESLQTPAVSSRKTRSATSNAKGATKKSTAIKSDGSQKITSFFGK